MQQAERNNSTALHYSRMSIMTSVCYVWFHVETYHHVTLCHTQAIFNLSFLSIDYDLTSSGEAYITFTCLVCIYLHRGDATPQHKVQLKEEEIWVCTCAKLAYSNLSIRIYVS